MKKSLLALLTVTGCASARSPDDPDNKPPVFGPTPTEPTPPGCVYQRHEATHPVAGIGELSQCLELPIAGDDLFSVVYSDFVPERVYIGGLAGATLRRDGANLQLAIGPHVQAFVPEGARFVRDDGTDGSWFEASDDGFVEVAGATRISFTGGHPMRPAAAFVIGGASGATRLSGIAIARDDQGNATQITDDFGGGIQIGYDGAHPIRIADLETGVASELDWDAGRITAARAPGATEPIASTLGYGPSGRLVTLATDGLGGIAWDRPVDEQVARTRFLDPAGNVTYAITSAGCIALDRSRLVAWFGHPYGSIPAPARFHVEQLLAKDEVTAQPTRRTTDDLGKYVELYFDRRDRPSQVSDETGVGLLFTYDGSGRVATRVRARATGIDLFVATIADPARQLYATFHGLDGLETAQEYDTSGRLVTATVGGHALHRTFEDTGSGTRICDQIDGQTPTCVDEDLHGQPVRLDSAGTVGTAGYQGDRLAFATDALGDRTTYQYTEPAHQLSRIDRTDGSRAELYAFTQSGAPRSIDIGARSTGIDYTPSGLLESIDRRIGAARWHELFARSTDLATTTYFLNGKRMWSEHTDLAPEPADVDCKEGGGK